jgi:hypothetical protein
MFSSLVEDIRIGTIQHELLGNVAPVLLLLGLDARLAHPVTQLFFGPIVRAPRSRRLLKAAK